MVKTANQRNTVKKTQTSSYSSQVLEQQARNMEKVVRNFNLKLEGKHAMAMGKIYNILHVEIRSQLARPKDNSR